MHEAYLDERIRGFEPDYDLVMAFLPPPVHYRARVLLALKNELWDLLLGISETEVAMARLQWWREEWARVGSGEARHPVTQAVAKAKLNSAAAIDPALYAAGIWHTEFHPDDMKQMVESLDGLAAFLADVEGHAVAPWSRLVHAELLERIPALSAVGRSVLPMKEAARLGLRREDLARDGHGKLVQHHIHDKCPSVSGESSVATMFAAAAWCRAESIGRPRRGGRFVTLWRVWKQRRVVNW